MSDKSDSAHATSRETARQWSQVAKAYAQPQALRSTLQLLTTALPLAGLWAAMILTVNEAYWATLLLAIPAAAFTMRMFIIQHDCGHRSFYRSARLNAFVGNLIGVVTLTPHEYWRRAHNIHHATCGNLQQRGIGDISLLTVAEYTALPTWKRLAYRIYRTPFVILVVGPIYVFILKFRLPLDLILRKPGLLIGVMGTNLGIVGMLTVLGMNFGFTEILMIQFPVIFLSSSAGVWLFYVQHQFEHTYWRKETDWDFSEASVMASSYYDLPQPLRWLTGDIGIHHIHHLSSRIPNYRLADCLAAIPAMQTLNRISIRESLSTIRLALWDEAAGRLVSFKSLGAARAATA